MSVIFRIRPAGILDGATVPVITSAVQDPLTGIYDVSFNSLNDNFGELDIQELFRIALGNRADDFLVPQLILTDGPATTVLELAKLAYSPAGAPAGVNRELLWEYISAAPGDVIGPKPFMTYTGQRLVLQSDNAVPGESEIYLVAYPVTAGELIDAICCTNEGDAAAAPPAATCCAPQYIGFWFWQGEVGAFNLNPGVGALDFAASLCGQDEPITAVFRGATSDRGADVPLVTNVAYAAAPFSALRVDYDASGVSDGDFVLEITNECGCCSLIALTLQTG